MEPPFLYAVCGLFGFIWVYSGLFWVYSGLSGLLRRFSRSSRFVASYPHIGDIFELPTPLGMPWLPCLFRKSRISKRETGFFAYGGTVQTVLRRFYTPVCEMSRIFLSFSTFSRKGGATKGIVGYSTLHPELMRGFSDELATRPKMGNLPRNRLTSIHRNIHIH